MSSPGPWQDARQILETGGLDVPIEWPNELHVQPGESMWLRVDMAGDTLRPIELGPAGAWLEEGELMVDVIVPAGHGTAEARQMAKRITNLFRALGPRPVVWRRATIGRGGPDENDKGGTWWFLPVTIGYSVQDVPTQ